MAKPIRGLHNTGGRLFGRAYYRNMIRIKFLLSGKREPVLIWQMGKVGSSTVLNSLQKSQRDTALFHVHVLSNELINRGELIKKSIRHGTVAHLENEALREQLLSRKTRWKIISLVREPVGRNISAFFQNLDLYAPDIEPNDINQIQLLRDIFFQEFDHDRPLTWFDYEIKSLLGIDVFAEPFPKNKGYAEYKTDLCDLLVLRMEDLNTIGTEALKHFLDLPRMELAESNVGSKKNYADTYTQLRRQIGIPVDYLVHMYESKYTRHFYTEEEIARFRSRWKQALT